jgi:hypothetical protein
MMRPIPSFRYSLCYPWNFESLDSKLYTSFGGFYKFVQNLKQQDCRNYKRDLHEVWSKNPDLRMAEASPSLVQHAPASRLNLVRGEKTKGERAI